MLSPGATAALAGTRFGDVRVVASIDSTNRQVLELARAGAAEGLVLVADHQTAGRGRRGRSWVAPPGSSLLASVLLRPHLPVGLVSLCTTAAGLAAIDACLDLTAVRLHLKWPNDIVSLPPDGRDRGGAGARKVAGLLADAVVVGDSLGPVVVGMGLNLRSTAVPSEVEDAVALDQLSSVPVGRDDLLVGWLVRLEERCRLLDDEVGRRRLLDDYREASATLGRRVRVELEADTIVGTAADVGDDGRLLLRSDDGVEQWAAAGDVVHLRAAST